MKALPLDFIVRFCGEVRSGLGEDNWCYGFNERCGMIAAFDGCGGSGARKHDAYAGHTEAFMASRLCSGVFYESLNELLAQELDAQQLVQSVIVPRLIQRFKDNAPNPKEGGIQIKGSMVRTLPTTAAAAIIHQNGENELLVSSVWAGDSRTYILDETGLAQLSTDDSTQPDPLEGQYDDGVLTNVVCKDKSIRLNCRTIKIKIPFVVLTVTDGCYGYVTTPMEFEGILLRTLLNSCCAAQWEAELQSAVRSVAGDDHTMCLASFGYSSFEELKRVMSKRYAELKRKYLNFVSTTPLENREIRRELWTSYRKAYMKYIEGEPR